MITFSTPKHHWNYFLAIEKDLEHLSRYIEFAKPNLATYSIELAHILLSASSEVDVIMKQLCALVDTTETDNINEYKAVIQKHISSIINEEILIERFGLLFKPLENWKGTTNPDWWKGYNKVKHERNEHYHEANLQNTINAVGALLLVVTYYYKHAFSKEAGHEIDFRETTRQLQPESTFISINANYYYSTLIG